MNRAATIALAPLSGIYETLVRSGNVLYRRNFFRRHKVDAPVISVGNLTTGGTGKTPLVEWLARDLARAGRRVCVVTRGYRRESSGRLLVSNGEEILTQVDQAGDEAFLLAEELKGKAAVLCDADRLAAARWAIDNLKSDAFVLDDGFQHQRLGRDLNIVTIDATNPWGNGLLLPAGILREPRTALSRADCVVITRADDSNQIEDLESEIQTFAPGVKIFRSRMIISRLRELAEPQSAIDIGDLVKSPVAAFCGVGNPQSFFSLLRRNGFELKLTRAFRDHHKYTQADIDRARRAAETSGARALLTTAKDAVKISSRQLGFPCYSAEIKIEFDDDDDFRKLVSTAIIHA